MIKKKCSKCGRTLNELEFFKMKNGERADMCKDCITQYIDNRNPETFLWILEKFDIPFLKNIWIQKTNEIYLKNPGKFGPKSVIGTYIRMMNMKQYSNLHYADSDHLKEQEETPQELSAEDEAKEEELKQKFENGEISKAEYDTLSKKGTKVNELELRFIEPEEEINPLQSQTSPSQNTSSQEEDVNQSEKIEIPFAASYAKDDAYWANQLTPQDIDYLILKWGVMYSPQQWITMETMYNKYAEEYDLNSDREEVLKKMCKTSLKMDLALDANDVTSYKNLATVFDQLRKSGKFTESQKKEEKTEILSTIGELVALVEQQEGIIEALPQFDPNQYPQDKIDFTLKDLKAYTYSLVSNELGLGDLIESYITKLERAEKNSVDVNEGLITSLEEEKANQLTDKEVEEFNAAILENDIESEAEELLRMMELGEI